MITKVTGIWLVSLSIGTGGVIILGDYMRSKGIGIQFNKYSYGFRDYPVTIEGWNHKFAIAKITEQPSDSKLPNTLEEFKEKYFALKIKELHSHMSILSYLFPLSNMSLTYRRQRYIIPMSESDCSNILYLAILGPLYPFFKKNRSDIPSNLAIPLFLVGSNLYVLSELSKLQTMSLLRSLHAAEKPNIGPITSTLHSSALFSLFSVSLYFGLSFVKKFPGDIIQCTEKPELVKLIQSRFRIIAGLSGLFTLLGFYKETMQLRAFSVSKRGDMDLFRLWDNNLEKKWFTEIIDEKIIRYIRVGSGVMNYVLLMNLVDHNSMRKSAFSALVNARGAFFVYNAMILYEIMHYYRKDVSKSSSLLNLTYFSLLVYGLAGLRLARVGLIK